MTKWTGKIWLEVMSAVALFAALPLVFFWEAVFLDRALLSTDVIYHIDPIWREIAPSGFKRPSNQLLTDVVYQFYPWRAYVTYWLSQGEFPLWNASALAGYSLLGNDQSALFYPINLLSYLLPLTTSFTFTAVVRLLVVGLSTYAYLRVIDRSIVAAYLGAIAFTLSGPLTVWLGYSIVNVAIWLPTILLLLELIFRSGRLVWLGLLMIVTGAQYLGGHIETSFHIMLVSAVYALFLAGRGWALGAPAGALGGLIRSSLGALGGIAVGGVQLLPFLDQLTKSTVVADRAAANVSSHWFNPEFWQQLATLPTLFFPTVLGSPVDPGYYAFTTNYNEYSAYVGTIPLLLAFAVATRFWRDGRTALWLVVGLLSLAIAYRFPLIEAVNHLPLFDVTANGRLRLVFSFAAATMAATGVDWLLGRVPTVATDAKRDLRVLTRVSAIFSLVAITALAGAFLALNVFEETFLALSRRYIFDDIYFGSLNWRNYLPVFSAMFLAGVSWLASRKSVSRFRIVAALPVATAFELMIIGIGYNPTIDHARVFPTTPVTEFLREHSGAERIVGLDHALTPNTAMIWGLQDLRGYENVPIARTWALLREIEGRLPWGGYLKIETIDSRLLDLLGVRYIVAGPKSKRPDRPGLYPAFTHGGVTIYENQRALPRAYVVSEARAFSDPDEVLARIRTGAFNPRTEVLLEADQSPNIDGLKGVPSVAQITEHRPNRVSVRAELRGDGYLVLSDSYDDGWYATVDGHPQTIYRANYAFRAVRLGPGIHQVEFEYYPRAFIIGAVLTTLSLALSLSLIGFASFVRPRHRSEVGAGNIAM